MPVRRVAVAASGGRDSCALLHCTLRMAKPLGIEVVALHVNHGLMPAADHWLRHVQQQARRWGAGFASQRLEGRPASGQSVEAWARHGRYQALSTMAREQACSAIWLAHHRGDQAETWLLQALRGAGPAGLAAMPSIATRAGLPWCRPWLDMPRAAIEAYVRRHRLRYVDDESNDDARFARNRLRQQVLPVLFKAFPDAEAALVAAALRAQEAQALATEVAQADLAGLVDLGHKGALCVQPWLNLSPARRLNVLRYWLSETLQRGAPQTLVQRLVEHLSGPRGVKGWVRWPAPEGELMLYRGLLTWRPAQAAPAPATAAPTVALIDLSKPGFHAAPGWGGVFEVRAVQAGGLPAALLRGAQLRPRQGGERFALHPHATPRSLKKQYQSAGVPEPDRAGPLVFDGSGALLYVPGLGPDARQVAAGGELQRALTWRPQAKI